MSDIAHVPPPIPSSETPEVEPVLFYPVVRWKFILLSVVTFGLYELYWCYRNWCFVKESTRPEIRPFWRAVFAPLWLYSLQKAIDDTAPKNRIILLALAYFLLAMLSELPEPYWLLSMFTFVPLLPVLSLVNGINADPEIRAASNYSRFGWKHCLVTLVGGLFVLSTVLSSLYIIPGTQVVAGSKVGGGHRDFMAELGVFSPEEELILFYSAGIFSLKEDGNFFTDQRVASYWENYEGEGGYEVESAFYSEIKHISVNYSNSEWIDSELIILREDDSDFTLYLSSELGRDRDFVSQVMERWRIAKPLSSVE